jgi:hypothetical protein
MSLFTRLSHLSNSTTSDLQETSKWQDYCDLELIPTEKRDRHISNGESMLALLANLWQNAIAALTKEPELKVWQKRDRHGNTLWHAYDPWTGDSVCLGSETEMLSWIESRYYHR